jgi:hypothetical protein
MCIHVIAAVKTWLLRHVALPLIIIRIVFQGFCTLFPWLPHAVNYFPRTFLVLMTHLVNGVRCFLAKQHIFIIHVAVHFFFEFVKLLL